MDAKTKAKDISIDELDVNDGGTQPVPDTVVMSNGIEVKIKAVSPMLLDKVKNSVEFPPVPTYTTKTVTGHVETFPHDESTLESDDDKQAWAAYKFKEAQAQELQNERVMRALFIRGVDIKVPEDNDWKDEQEAFGVQIPTEKIELKIHYIMTEIVSSPHDMVALMTGIMRLTGIDEEVVRTAEESFRLAMEGAGRDSVDSDEDTESGELVSQQQV